MWGCCVIFGLTGASGTGKTTLGRELAKRLVMPFVPTSISDMAQELGLPSPVSQLNLIDRAILQNELLVAMLKFLENLPSPCIIDRTPLDLMAYLLAEVDMHAHADTPEKLHEHINNYANICINVTKRAFTCVYCLEPLPVYKSCAKRPVNNPAYHRHVQLLIKGGLVELGNHVPNFTIKAMSLEDRVNLVSSHIVAHMDELHEMRATAKTLH